ncbi:hypothetical protein GCM10009116_15630 [Brevundimonas basaltis]|uniref:Uncharacterized protein n=1 Tax=Brevundimonas basaltis TaxID=472166 RepID=A0A7W8HWK9_9CAUL|nr:hypothetical protein [Brevundimonas basaltis]MBB5291125.1 hypothetical protein [Brevundimonas basaltis]
MGRIGILVVGLALAIPVGWAEASIPPSYRVLVVSADKEAEAQSDALVQYMSALEAFARVAPAVREHEVRACLEDDDFGGCVRGLVPAPEHWQDPRHIVIRAEGAGSGRLSWTCVGSGAYRAPTAAQQVELDARTAIFGEGDDQTGALRAAMDCVRSAALESSRP